MEIDTYDKIKYKEWIVCPSTKVEKMIKEIKKYYEDK
jgi:hypothetical protein